MDINEREEEQRKAKLRINILNKEYDPDCFIDLKHLAIAVIALIAIGSLFGLLISANYFLENFAF